MQKKEKKWLYQKRNIFLWICFLAISILYWSTYIIKVDIQAIPFSTVLYDEKWEEIGEIIKDNTYRHRKVDISLVPEFTKKALITIEDRNFYSHHGIDILGIVRALSANVQAGELVQWGSTLDTQLIRNMYWLNSKRTFGIKIKELFYALALNHRYTKDQILEAYLSHISFGYLNYGIESASQYYFGKMATNLTKAEQLALLTLPKNPTKYDPYKENNAFQKRFSILAKHLFTQQVISKKELEEILLERITWKQKHDNILPYAVDFYQKNTDSSLIHFWKLSTTLDKDMSLKIDEIAKQSIMPLAWKNVSDYSIVIIDRRTKVLKVLIWGKDFWGQEGQVNGVLAQRQAWSTIKPFTYLLAFQNLWYTPSTKVIDTPIQFQTSEGFSYSPKNYSLDFKGEVSIAEALSQSINVPAIKTVDEVGEDVLHSFLKKVWISSLDKNPEYYGLALTLGVWEVSLFELTRAFSLFAYDGYYCTPISVVDTDSKCIKLVEKKYTDMIQEILTNRYFKLNGFPINSNLDFEDREVFVKTGTSRNFRDNWSIGFTKNYIIGVWVGNKDGSPMKGVSGATGAGEIFRSIVYFVEKEKSTSNVIHLDDQKKEYLEITSPLDKSTYKIDLTKPLSSQAIKLESMTNIAYTKQIWKVDWNVFSSPMLPLKKGVHVIETELFDEAGKSKATKKSSIEVQE